MECGFGFQDLVHNFGHFITSVLHNFGSALYLNCNKRFSQVIKQILISSAIDDR